ncbi:MAG: N-acetyltransferase [Geminicoccaceae bacterium]|nr:MAG: N-acetyltransferase [Geminicoccaceae bacterium]
MTGTIDTPDLDGWQPRPLPPRTPMQGRLVRLEPIDPQRHASALFRAAEGPGADPRLWDWMTVGPFGSEAAFRAWLDLLPASEDPLFFTILTEPDGVPRGMASFMRITPEHGVIEIGHIWLGTGLQRSPAATEAMWLLARRAFDELGYRRLEWKCDARNGRSIRAALRLGFTFEGVFRRHMIIKGRNRDTAWFALLDRDWPRVDAAFRAWLDPTNFGPDGRQRRRLEEIRTSLPGPA